MRVIVRSLAAAVLLLAGCGASHGTSSAPPNAAASPAAAGAAGGLTLASTHAEGKLVVATATAPPGWSETDALSRGDDLSELVGEVRARHAKGAVRVQVTARGKVVATAESPANGRLSFSLKK
ncbi:MAG TPA: hypothetical protein VNJ51_12900 [Candidatus Dormibacteraeota bacterium]|nr:hypothetical protein [Candidatus Dormibacteraeota bacterium]